MPKICKKCNVTFPYTIKIDGKIRNLGTRKYCLECSPFGKHNTAKLEISKDFKVCGVCKENKSINDYYMKTDGYPYYYCKICMNKSRVKYQQDNKQSSINYLGGKCQCCGYNKCNAALEFHHKDPSQKDFTISHFKGTKLDKLKPELDKCVLLCSNCHRETHSGLHTW